MKDDSTRNQEAQQAGLDRRDFLRVGAASAATFTLGATAEAGAATGTPAEVTGPQPGGAAASTAVTARVRQAQDPPKLPPNAVDPTSVEVETWLEPWVWRPATWPDEALELNVVQFQNPGPATSPGNPFPSLFSFGGISPAPTIRARGEDIVRVTLRNMLRMNHQQTPVGPCPDPIDVVPAERRKICALVAERTGAENNEDGQPPRCNPFLNPEESAQVIPQRMVPGYELVDHANGLRTARATNIHTHGLHVPPNFNPDGSLSDNVLMRVIPRGDWEARQQSDNASVKALRPHERVARADYEFQLGAGLHGSSTEQPHPPGTHWYHPHAHGSTHDQVSSGMAGFFIIEGDVDDAVNRRMTGVDRPEPDHKTGDWDYRERLILIQRVFLNSLDLDAGPREKHLRFPPLTAVNGVVPAGVMTLRPGAVERWRVLNGSVDGSGFKRFMVLEGEFAHVGGKPYRVIREPAPDPAEGGGDAAGDAAGGDAADQEPRMIVRLEPVTRREIADAKVGLYMLSYDGITLVSTEGGRARHAIRDLSKTNPGTYSPLERDPTPGADPVRDTLRNIEDCYRDGDSLRLWYNRPNEVYLGNANRTDVLFKVPLDAAGKVYTLFAQEENLHTDNFQQRLQMAIDDEEDPTETFNRPPVDVVVGYVHVRGDPVEGGDFDVMRLNDVMPPVPPFLRPVQTDELRASAAEALARNVPSGSLRTRVVSYSGWGGADFPLIYVPESFSAAHPELKGLVWDEHEDQRVLLANYTRTMAINTEFDLAVNPEPAAPRKFAPDDPVHPRVGLGTAEEWVLYNNSLTMWAHTDAERYPQPGRYGLRYRSYPIPRSEGQRRFAEDPEFQITSKGSDHPFHIHINPMWVMRIDVPDENGNLHNVLDAPRWMDTVPIPRNGGRVVFRSRFLDFTGQWVNHCHILQHEDNGMMQVVECVERAADANWNPRRRVADHGMTAEQVDAIYPKPSLEVMYRQNIRFVDPSPATGQVYPGFDAEPPVLDD